MSPMNTVSLLPGRTGWSTRPRLVAIDVDHTLIRSDRTLAPATIDAVHNARAAGIEVVLASSRPPLGMTQFLLPLGLVEPATFVAFQGAFVGTYSNDGGLVAHATSPIDREVALGAARAARSVGMATNWYTSDGWFVDRRSNEVMNEADIVGMRPRVVDEFGSVPPPLKLLFIAERAGHLDTLRPLLSDAVSAETSHPTYLEVTAGGIDKATGVRVAAARAGIAMNEAVAIGDGRNDLGLFRKVLGALAPANADASVLAEADYITPSNDADGVAVALNWLSLLRRA